MAQAKKDCAGVIVRIAPAQAQASFGRFSVASHPEYERPLLWGKTIMSLAPYAPVLLAAAAVLLVSCGASTSRESSSGPSSQALSSGIDLAGMDRSVAPGDDFNAYANGGWIKATPIPPDKARYGVFTMLADETRRRTVDLIQNAAKNGSPGRESDAAARDAQRIGDLYASFMDQAGIEAKGLAPLKPRLDAIAAIANRQDLARVLGGNLRADVDPLNATNFYTDNLFGVWVTQGLADPSHNYPYLLQGGLGMPDRDYYLSKSAAMADLRKQYQEHLAAMFRLAGFSDPGARGARVFALETKMAQVHATRVESEDVHAAVTWKRGEFPTKAPGINWPTLLEAAGLNDAPEFVIWHPKAIPGLSALVAKEPLDSWKTGSLSM